MLRLLPIRFCPPVILWGLWVMVASAAGQTPVITSQPQSETVALGSLIDISVSVDPASVDENVSYQWYAYGAADGLPQLGGTTSSISYLATTWLMAGTFYVVISDNGNSVTSQTATLAISGVQAPSLAGQPSDASVELGGDVLLAFPVTGTGPFEYQWYFNGAPVFSSPQVADITPLQTTAQITYFIQVTSASAGSYYATAWNSAGTVTSNSVNVTVAQPPIPEISIQPMSGTVDQGSGFAFSVFASVPGSNDSDLNGLSYQWYFNGSLLAGATASDLNLFPTTLSQAGTYYVVVSDITGSVTSASATLTVTGVSTVAITSQPQSQTTTLGTTVTFSTSASGSGTLTYSWYQNNAAAVIGTGPTLTLSNVQASDQGEYYCSVTNGSYSASSVEATLSLASVGVNPTIVDQPGPQSGPVGGTASFNVYAIAAGNLTYQWYFNGLPVAGAIQDNLAFPSLTVANAGSYTVEVTSPYGATLSVAASLTVTGTGLPTPAPTQAPSSVAPTPTPTPTSAPSSTPTPTPTPSQAPKPTPAPEAPVGNFSQPQSQTIASGSTVTFTVGAPQSGVNYQWFYNESPLSDTAAAYAGLAARAEGGGESISGSDSPRLLINGATASANGRYACQITGSTGAVMSTAATLEVSATTDPGRLINISCRSLVGTSANILIAGFAIGGSGTSGAQPLLIRASGPTLAPFGISGVLPDPALALFNAKEVLQMSDTGWNGNQAVAAADSLVGAFAWTDPSSADSALVASLGSGAYTAQVVGASNDTGVALVEVYDATAAGSHTAASPRLINISARIEVGTGQDILIAGFVIGGTTSKTVLIRASGPALVPFGVAGVLAKPALALYDATSTELTSNIGWQGDTQLSQVAAAVGAFSWGAIATPDSALLITLAPGAYTAQVQGADGGSGIALIEVYEVP